MPVEIDVAATIRKPRPDIASVVLNPECEPAWCDRVLDVQPLTDGPLVTGVRLRRTTRLLGRRFRDEARVADHHPGHSIVLCLRRPLPMRVRYSLEGIPEGAIMRIEVRADPRGLWRLLRPVLPRLLRRGCRRDLRALKNLMESNAFRSLTVPPAAEIPPPPPTRGYTAGASASIHAPRSRNGSDRHGPVGNDRLAGR
jgi:hypothetical protein